MPADVFIDTRDSRSNPVDDAIGQARGAYQAGVKDVWFGVERSAQRRPTV